MKRKPGRPRKEKTSVLYLRVPNGLAQALIAKAKTDSRPLTDTIRLMLEGALSASTQIK